MTNAEKITLYTGQCVQQSQLLLKNAFKYSSLLTYSEKSNSRSIIELAEKKSVELVNLYQYEGTDKIISFLTSIGFQTRMIENIKYVLKKRDYLVNFFYIDNEKIMINDKTYLFEAKISEVQMYVLKAREINNVLLKDIDNIIKRLK